MNELTTSQATDAALDLIDEVSTFLASEADPSRQAANCGCHLPSDAFWSGEAMRHQLADLFPRGFYARELAQAIVSGRVSAPDVLTRHLGHHRFPRAVQEWLNGQRRIWGGWSVVEPPWNSEYADYLAMDANYVD